MIASDKGILNGLTNDGSTNVIELYNSDNVLVKKIDTNGFSNYEFEDVLPNAEWINSGGWAAPDTGTYTIWGIQYLYKNFDWTATTESMSNTYEILHWIDIASLNADIVLPEIHTHWMASTTTSGNVKIFFNLTYQPVNSAPVSRWTFSTLITINANGQYFHRLWWVILTKPTGWFNVWDHILVQYSRVPTDVQDTYAWDWIFMQCALHMPFNSDWSRQRYAK